MQRFFLDIEKLHVGDQNASAHASHVFLAQPTPLEEQALGRLFILVDIAHPDENATNILRTIQNELKESYYHTEELAISTAFEEALNHVNRKLHSLVREGITDWLEEFSALIGVIHGEHIIFTHLGRMDMFLILGRRMVNVLDSPERDEPANPLKIFSSIVEGELTEGSSVLMTTSTLLDYFSQEKLRQLIVGRPTHEAITALEQLLHEHQHDAEFLAITARLIPTHDEVPMYRVPANEQPRRVPTGSDASMDDLIIRENKTNELLAPSILAEAGKRSSKIAHDFASFWRTKIQHKPERRIHAGGVIRSPHSMSIERPHYFLQFVALLERGLRILVGGGVRGVQKLRKEKPIHERALELPKETEGLISKQVIRFQHLPKNRKIILMIALVALVVFAQSIVWLGQRSRNAEQTEQLALTFVNIEENLLDAETSLSFGDNTGAQSVLRENIHLLDDAHISNKNDRERADDLRTRTDVLLNETRNIHTIDTMVVKADFTSLSPDAQGTKLVAVGTLLYAYNPNTNALYRVGTDELELTVIAPPDFALGDVRIMTTDGERILLLNNDNLLFAYSPDDDTWSTLSFPIPAGEHNFTAATTFLDRLYMVDANENQIFRFPAAATGFGGSSTWVRDEVIAFTNAIDIDIDGNVYITFNDGTIQRYFQGARDTFSLKAVDPELTVATAMWTIEGSEGIYILDGPGKRVVRFTKEGQFVEQYSITSEAPLLGFSVDEVNQRIFILNGQTVSEFSISE
ncbi:MAG: hypothetical protein WCV86_02860 [Patescibacteria group bacterium]|jgi:hypothetical protein